MKFSCNTKLLLQACSNVMKAVSTKVTIPAIEGILIKAAGSSISLTGYDFEFGIHTALPAQVEREGSIILNAKILCDIIRRMPDAQITFDANDRFNTSITCREAQYSIMGIDADEYPELPIVSGGVPVILNQELLKNMVNQTAFAVAESENAKTIHTGFRFEIAGSELKIIGVDGFRLAIRTEKIQYDGEDISFVVPKKTVKELVKLFNDPEKDVSISVGRCHIVFEAEEYSVISRLLEGDFINYRSVIPKTVNTKVQLNTMESIETVERTLPVIDNNSKNPIRCIFDEGMMRVSTITSLGKVIDTCPAQCTGDRVEIGFNSKYLLEALHAADTDAVRIEIDGPTYPVMIAPVQGESFLFLVSPVRLKKNEN